ncbi:hypothetical protein SEA_PHRANN_31 [Mycobacterium phage Phrann]|uniref:Uncharacterized protein n=1 Tax=Mycobacterium phage Phrann TaxID=1821541 RepID=A0A142K824_9CAUD|nr:hypothetical protein BJD68_gp31 [Mycobacterium phage Phrann]AMS02257.1 hypothetical protein SEA_PHRANN_31 [Mycobacterium phage Phrann]
MKFSGILGAEHHRSARPGRRQRGAIIAAIGTIVVGVITVRGQRKGRDRWSSDRETLREIHEQAVNNHRGKRLCVV